MAEAPLDMRMDQGGSLTAWEVVNTWDENRLNRILWDYGEERCARRISSAIVKRRAEKPIESTQELVEIIRSAMPAAALREKQHPAKRSFQAIRIAVNDELGAIASMMETAPDKLNPGGRLCVISFHSLEDRIVKTAFRTAENPCVCPPRSPQCVCGRTPYGRILTKHPLIACEAEQRENPRSVCCKLRALEKLGPGIGTAGNTYREGRANGYGSIL
jgi:16S rRNA (cytosine1402-N4)-methyltransferase